MEPTTFRRNLNTVIQELRNISWLIQKQKNRLDNFSEWYPAWQESAMSDEIMRWITTSRNRVVKEGDLDIASTARIRYQSPYHETKAQEMDAPARLTTGQMLAVMMRGRVPDQGILTVSREWRDSQLDGHELLGALSHAWRECATLVRHAHGAMDPDHCFDAEDWSRGCVTSGLSLSASACLSHRRDYFELAIDLQAKTLQRTRYIPVERDAAMIEEARGRYGELPTALEGDAIDAVPKLVRMGRAILSVDESLLTTVYYYKGGRVVDFQGVMLEDRIAVIRHMAQVAERVRELGADSVAFSSEVWLASLDATQPGVHAGDRTDRTEALCIQAVRADGTARVVTVRFTRDANGEKRFESPSGAVASLSAFEPLRQHWHLRRWWILTDEVATEGYTA